MECIAAGVLVPMFAFASFHAPNVLMRAGAAVVSASGLWIIFYTLRYGGATRPVEPDQSLAAFQQALLGKYKQQIRLLRNVKFWYLLPPYVGLLLLSSGLAYDHASRGRLGWNDAIGPAIYTVIFAAIWWLNEVNAVRRLKRECRRLQELTEVSE
jgi:hypothetical protein